MKIFTEMTADKTRVCKCCGRELPISSYEINPRFRGMVGSTCHECVSAKKSATRDKKAARREERARERVTHQIERANRLSGLRERLEEKIDNMSARELLEELDRRGFLNEQIVKDYKEIYK